MASVQSLVRDRSVTIAEIGAHLDDLAPAQREVECRELSASDMIELFDRAAASATLDIRYFVPDEVPDGQPVVHAGWNSLPLPSSGRTFAKVFTRASGESKRLFGYNDSSLGPVIGPGFYVAYDTTSQPEWAARGGVVIDYAQVPDGPVPAGWPKVVPNWWGLQAAIYWPTRDFMRRVSSHVSIGAAWAVGIPVSARFMLVRRDP